MKYGIGVAVIALHLVLLAVFFGPTSRRGEKPLSPTPVTPTAAGAGPTATALSLSPRPAPPTTPTPPAAPLATPLLTPPPAGQALAPYSTTFFAKAVRPLPRQLEAAAAACRTGVVIDWSARKQLWGKAETRTVPIASLTKMMTVLVLVQDLETRTDLDLTTPIPVTREAALVGGRQVWLDPRETFPLQDIMRCALIHSANDAAFLLAQRVSGSESAFVKRMQERATLLGVTGLAFHNAHGLPEGPTQRENTGCAIELAYLAGRLLQYPQVLEWTGTRLSYLEPRLDGKKTQLLNTNRLVGRVRGVNGMKTGFTDKAGYCLVATCDRARRQVIVAVTGCARSAERDDLATGLIEWAYATP
jgi:D-alanyl-D-alanine carboxypeptidase (penicillin-binding protein 5/6)